MDTQNFRATNVDQCRLLMNKAASMSVGKSIILIHRKSAIPSYSDDVKNNRLRLSHELSIWSTSKEEIKSFAYDYDANGRLYAIFNGKEEYRTYIQATDDFNKMFPKVTAQSLRDTYERSIAQGTVPLFFDYPETVQQIVALNNGTRDLLNGIVKTLMDTEKMLRDANTVEINACKLEMANFGVTDLKFVNTCISGISD